MRVLISTDQYTRINGVSLSVKLLKEELTKNGHDVKILTLSPNKKSYVKDGVYYVGSVNIPIKTGDRFTFKYKDKLIKNIVIWNPDIIHVQSEFSTYIIAKSIAKACNAKTIHTCHTLYDNYTNYFCPSKKIGKYIIEKVSKKIYNKASCLIVPTMKVKKIMCGYGVSVPIHIIPTGINLNSYKLKINQTEKENLLTKLGIKKDRQLLVTVSRLGVEKNIDEIINYLPSLIEKQNNIALLIVGEGKYRINLEKLVKKLNLDSYVFFAGLVEPKYIYKYYQLGDIFVCASTSESQGLTYIEALANSLPLVCKKDDCLKDIIFEEENGYTFTSKREFVESIYNILNNKNLYSKMMIKSLNISKKFSKERFACEVQEIYLQVLIPESEK